MVTIVRILDINHPALVADCIEMSSLPHMTLLVGGDIVGASETAGASSSISSLSSLSSSGRSISALGAVLSVSVDGMSNTSGSFLRFFCSDHS